DEASGQEQNSDDEPMLEFSGDEQPFDPNEPSKKRKRATEAKQDDTTSMEEAERSPEKQQSMLSAPKLPRFRGGIPIRDPRPFYPCWGGPIHEFEAGDIHYIPEDQWP